MGRCALTQDRLKEVLDYDPETGELKWKKQLSNRIKVGKRAGFIIGNGRRYVSVDGYTILEHRLIWLYMTGDWPDGEIDHINHKPADNRLANLRVVSKSTNMKNQALFKSNKTGITGVLFHKRDKRWYAQIRSEKKCYHLGVFRDFFEACCARKSAEVRYGFHENHGTILNS